jgi:hypothetical protein
MVAEAVLTNRSARRQIPVDREKHREFCAFAPFSRGRVGLNRPAFPDVRPALPFA